MITQPKTIAQVLEYVLIATSFLIPFLISGPQFLTGSIVNTLLFLFVSQTHSKKVFPIILLPSIGAVLNGILFGTLTVFLLYFLPFIWIGNYIMVQSFRYFQKKNSYIFSVLVSSLLKCVVLFSVAYFLATIKIVPPIFIQAMGLFQLYTALAGGLVALLIHKIIVKKI